ncbi:helix-turn-helix domain-containing protein [Streptomyces sodiiphilus]|uniref:ArsR/SmtB family transcription factor n=1 Tax=Streptomyces sodiiphilus TaxID=226217 RepID=UPI0031D6BD7E
MLRIRFTTTDIARTRLRPTLGPLVETACAAGLLAGYPAAPYARWNRLVSKRVSGLPASLLHGVGAGDQDALLRQVLRGACRPVPPEEQPGQAPWLNGFLAQVWRVAVAPYWEGMLAYLEADCESRGRCMMAGGTEQLLKTLHPGITWRSPVLEVPGGPDEEVTLAGRGVELVPSVFLHHRPAGLWPSPGDGRPVLLFATLPRRGGAPSPWPESVATEQDLGALIGHTRAAALRALRATCTTSQLAERLGISPAGASQHTAVLRQSGLITTRRIRNSVLHTVTPLGVALLEGQSARMTAGARADLRPWGPQRASAGRASSWAGHSEPDVAEVSPGTRIGTAASRTAAELGTADG